MTTQTIHTRPGILATALIGACLLLAALTSQASAAPFGIVGFDGSYVRDAEGGTATQAGSHPFAITAAVDFTTTEEASSITGLVPAQNLKQVDIELPAGLIGDPTATPRCTTAQFGAALLGSEIGDLGCPDSTQVGVASFTTPYGTQLRPLWNLEPTAGGPGLIGFASDGVPVVATATVRPGSATGAEGFGLDLHFRGISQALAVYRTGLTFWGDPSDPAHEEERGLCLRAANGASPRPAGGCPVKPGSKPFVSMPTYCSGSAPTIKVRATAWNGEVSESSLSMHGSFGEPLGIEGCDQLPFGPSIATAFDPGAAADSPSGLAVDVHLPQSTAIDGLATSALRSTTVTLPPGVSINPSAANGLTACSVAQFDQFSEGPSSCPDASKVGTVEIDTPFLPTPLTGSVYVARQTENPFGTLTAIYLVAEGEGVRVKLPGKVELDQSTGRVTTSFDETPQLPFEDLHLNLFTGPRAVLATPVTCGAAPVASSLAPWSGTAAVNAGSSLTVGSGPGGSSCPGSAGQRSFGVSLEAGTRAPAAGSHSPFTLQVNRPDGAQEISTIDATLPKGLLASLKGVPECGDAQAASGTCGDASRIGSVTVGAGAGSNPFYVRTGRAYLTGPYKGAPLGLDFAVPAVAGPLDLGTVNVRAAVFVDPETAQVSVKSDPLPRILQGIPLRLRSVRVELDRDGFTLNPTSCDPSSITAHMTSTEGATADPTDRFQAAGCAGLGFGPKIEPRLLGGRKAAKRRSHPSLRVTVKEPQGQANLSAVSFAIPKKILLDQDHIRTVCTRVQFAAQQCPAASVYGQASVTTPLLDQPLTGPVYLRSSSNKLPDLVVDLKGQLNIVLAGRIGSRNGGIRAVFDGIPDAPISTFTLTMAGGKRGLLVNSVDLCKQPARAVVRATGQNGAVSDTKPSLASACAKKKGGGKKRKH